MFAAVTSKQGDSSSSERRAHAASTLAPLPAPCVPGHHPALATIVEETCRAHAIPYRAEPSLRAAVAAHHRHLRALGAPVPLEA